jgi:hypothetical protein
MCIYIYIYIYTVFGLVGGGGGRGFYVCVLITISNMGLCTSVNASFICTSFFVVLYI